VTCGRSICICIPRCVQDEPLPLTEVLARQTQQVQADLDEALAHLNHARMCRSWAEGPAPGDCEACDAAVAFIEATP